LQVFALAIGAQYGWEARSLDTHTARYLDERKRMMRAWADYLDGLKAGGTVIAYRTKVG